MAALEAATHQTARVLAQRESQRLQTQARWVARSRRAMTVLFFVFRARINGGGK